MASSRKNAGHLLLACALLAAGCRSGVSATTRAPVAALPPPQRSPVAPAPQRSPVADARVEGTVDDYFGTRVADPYRWLEDGESAEVKAWTERQNALSRRVLDAMPGRAGLEAKVRELLQLGTVSAPEVSSAKASVRRYFHTRREGAQNQPVLYVRDGADGRDRVLLDPAQWSSDATAALDWWQPSDDGALVAFGRSERGSEESTLYVRDVVKGVDLADRIPFTKHASVAWWPDRKGFFYSRHPAPGDVTQGDESYFRRIYAHKLGTDPTQDRLIFGDGRSKTDIPSCMLSPNGRWLVVRVHQGWQRSEVYLRDRARGERGSWIPVVAGVDALFDPIALDDGLYVRTNDGAPHFKLYRVDYAKPARPFWKEVIAERADVLDDVTPIGDTLIASYLRDAATHIERFDKNGRPLGSLALPTLGTAHVAGAWNGHEAFLSFASFVTPPQVLRVDLKSLKANTWDRVGVRFTPPDVTVSRMFAESKDGTKVPMFVIAKKAMVPTADTPTILYGYGGFNQNMTPAFSARALLTVARGGVWVNAVLRGGGEFGEQWHRAGMLGNKQNVFDDFIACAETLIRKRITSPARLGIIGGSNGGLLVAAALTQRPELFRAAASLVPLTDMLRYQRFRIGRLWVPEYGTAENPEQFKFLYAYSPYHRVKDGERYPAVLLTTAESDSRVDPMHARKMAARLQRAQASTDHPILLRAESRAGHGAGKPVNKLIDELTDQMSFLFHELQVSF